MPSLGRPPRVVSAGGFAAVLVYQYVDVLLVHMHRRVRDTRTATATGAAARASTSRPA